MRVTVVALAASLTLGGCSILNLDGSPTDQSGTKAAEPAVAPATGVTINGDGYSYSAPEGWVTPENIAKPEKVDTFAVNVSDSDGFADNMNVLPSPRGQVSSEQVETQGVQELKDARATEVTVGSRSTIAGSESAHLSALFTSGQTEYRIEQYYLTHNAKTFIVTFSFSSTVSQADRETLAKSVLATWNWS
ncbi:MAG: hypothetical protein KF801_05760 [Cryobacterium sp.]|nr:hypothetical protein [Cryobacterium sp.]